jgi:hypothetical protein
LERLVVDHHHYAILRREKRIQPGLRICLHDAVPF